MRCFVRAFCSDRASRGKQLPVWVCAVHSDVGPRHRTPQLNIDSVRCYRPKGDDWTSRDNFPLIVHRVMAADGIFGIVGIFESDVSLSQITPFCTYPINFT